MPTTLTAEGVDALRARPDAEPEPPDREWLTLRQQEAVDAILAEWPHAALDGQEVVLAGVTTLEFWRGMIDRPEIPADLPTYEMVFVQALIVFLDFPALIGA